MPEMPSLDDLPEIMTLADAAAKVGLGERVLRAAIQRRELEAFVPRGRDPLHAGRGQGYRITKAALTRWYFGL